MTALALLKSIPEIVAEYDEKRAATPSVVSDFEETLSRLNVASSVGGTYGEPIFGRGGTPSLHERDIERALLVSAWRHVYKGLNIDKIAPAADRSRFEMELKNPPEFTLDNIRSTFGRYVANPRAHILRGLAEAFCNLDNAYKSHSKVKIGVAGLPKRVILSSVGGYGSYGTERLQDTVNALRLAAGLDVLEYRDFADWIDRAKKEPAEIDGVTLKRFLNGNGHLIFSPPMLRVINLALAEFYGEVLPDADGDEDGRPDLTSRAVAKDLQFYPTPQPVIERLLGDLFLRDGQRVLEPSCGDGRIMDALAAHKADLTVTGIEFDPIRAQMACAKGHPVQRANFLEVAPHPVFDFVVMNPPFYGRHYQKHVDHAKRFLKPGGTLAAVLPATARYDHDYVAQGSGAWEDLPVASFAESGTNIPTGIYTFRASSS